MLPVVAMVIAVPSYYERMIVRQQATLTEGTLTALTFDIETYLDDLDRMTITPYLNEDIMRALKQKSTFQWKLLTPFEQWLADQALYSVLPKMLRNTRKDILGTILLPMDGSVYISSPDGYLNEAVEGYPFKEQRWYAQALQADGKVAFIGVHKQNYLEGGGAEVFSVARLIKDPDTQRPLGVMMADADTVVLERILSGIPLQGGSIAAILDSDRNLIYASRPIGAELRSALKRDAGRLHIGEESYSVIAKTVSRSEWRIVVLYPESVIQRQLRVIYYIGAAFTLSGLLIAALLYFFVSRWMVTPFKRMVQVMKRVQRGDMKASFPVRGSDEIAQLGSNLNTMISRLGELIDSEYKAELGKRNAEYRALQSQIQPHFLYNTLNGFIGLNRAGLNVKLEKAILSLSGMLRYTLEHNDWTTVKEELAFIAKYVELQRMRFPDKLGLELECAEEAGNVAIPKLLLQPLVENAIQHGIEPVDRNCLLRIEAGMQERESGSHDLVIRISDDGAGFDPAGQRPGVGMTNVRERLRIACDKAEMKLESRIGRGTEVQIMIPVKEGSGR